MASVLLGFDPWYWLSIDPRHWSCAITHCTGQVNFYFFLCLLGCGSGYLLLSQQGAVFFFEMGCGSFSEGVIHISTSEVFSVALGASLFSCLI